MTSHLTSNLAVSLFVLACVFGGGLVGVFLRKVPPQDHLNAESKSTVNSWRPRSEKSRWKKLPVQVSICHGPNVVLMQGRGANQREREKEESPFSERQAILAQAILLAPVVASMFHRWAARNPMTNEERADVVQMLKNSANEYLSSIDINESQWHWKPAPERWSVGQTAEHIVQAEVVIFRRLLVAVQSPKSPDWETRTAGKADLLRRVMLDRTQKATAPETTRPQGLSKEETVRRFRLQRVQVITFAEETQIPLKEHTAEHPFPIFNTLNAYQWLLLVPLHHMRHHLQIGEIKASPEYPK